MAYEIANVQSSEALYIKARRVLPFNTAPDNMARRRLTESEVVGFQSQFGVHCSSKDINPKGKEVSI